uniref:Uncharacterized protein n=1 Tax=Acrobeloides nanus TaxID=290746 RepID=A0A914EJ98_9BILA
MSIRWYCLFNSGLTQRSTIYTRKVWILTNWLKKWFSDLFRERQIKLAALQHDPEIVEKLIETDKNIVSQLDEITKEQQSTLTVAGLPLFSVTEDPDEILSQIAIIEFIRSLSDLFPSDLI